MKTIHKITIIIAVIICAFGLDVNSIPSQAAGDLTRENFDYLWYYESHPVRYYTSKECSVWSEPNTSEQYRVKKIPAGYGVMIYDDREITSTKGDGKTFYKTVSGNYILCNCFVAQTDGSLTRENFDYEWYCKMHPDVYAYTHGDPVLTWNYYIMYGKPAGWRGRQSKSAYQGIYEQETLDILYNAADQITSSYEDQVEIARAVHDWVCERVNYDHSYSRSSLNAAVIEGLGVCEGYARTFDMLAKLCGIETEIVAGIVNNTKRTAGHAWNKVTINGNVSYVDTTWDDYTENWDLIVYYCFMVDEAEMNRIHSGTRLHIGVDGPLGFY